ncbi:hypothetical protein BaRGS_00028227 [Batillaria attramentaria]|uniref:Uncharacterized protein n=1 Tax=Batillaria attramentaria TaxID=370345 RepID=A0ABD0K0Y8_9CAEN
MLKFVIDSVVIDSEVKRGCVVQQALRLTPLLPAPKASTECHAGAVARRKDPVVMCPNHPGCTADIDQLGDNFEPGQQQLHESWTGTVE